MKRFLIVVDMQHDFIDGVLGSQAAIAMVPRCAAYISRRRQAGDMVIATMDTHGADYAATREGRLLPVPHCIRGTQGWQLHPRIKAALGDAPVVEKATFGSVDLPGIIRDMAAGDDISIDLVGLCTDICVVSNAMLLKAHFPQADVAVVADLCAGTSQAAHDAALMTMQSCQIEVKHMYTFDPEKARDNLIHEIKTLAAQQGFSKVVVGISGGKDSTVTAALCARALGAENVFGVMMPDGVQADIIDSERVCEALGINRRTVNIGAIHQALKAATDQLGDTGAQGEFSIPVSRAADINVGPRLRMTTLRYIAQALNARLVGTGNLSEATVGYCTKDGDTSCDFAALLQLTTVEVVQVGLTMPEIPRDLVVKTPSDGLTGRSDEENLGVSYQAIHDYIRHGTSGSDETDALIRRKEAANAHKRRMPHQLNPFGHEGTSHA